MTRRSPCAKVGPRRPGRVRRAAVCAAAGVWLWLAPAGAREAQEPQFRGGTNLVRLDVYVSKDGAAVTDLTAADFEVFEDNAPQTVTAFELVPSRGPVPETARAESNTVAESRSRVQQPDARAFVLFLDTLHVQLEGSYRAANPVAALLDRVIGADDLVGVMTPEMSPSNMTFSPRSGPIGDMLRAGWAWGERGALTTSDPREQELQLCYPDAFGTAGLAKAVIERRRQQQTLRALGELVDHLERLREQRTFVLLLTEGWTAPRPDESLAAALRAPDGTTQAPPPVAPIGVTPDGRLGTGPGSGPLASCERERQLLALADLDGLFRQLTERANRANVSFYPIDARGLVVFDDPIGPARPAPPDVDRARLTARQNAMRMLAEETDGVAVVNMAPERALPRLLTDIGAYYLLGYTSTNTKLDGRYRRLTVRVRRPGVTVRARPGYLAPTAREVARGTAAAAAAANANAVPGQSPGGTTRVTEALARLPVARRAPAVYLDAAAGAGAITAVVEIDRAAAAADWAKGGVVRLAVTSAERASGLRAAAETTLAAGTRLHVAHLPDGAPLPPGRYQVRLEALAEGARSPVVVTTLVDVPSEGALIGTALLASRRGPGTGRTFEPTADVRFRRTERLRLEVARLSPDAAIAARLLNRGGQVMQVPVDVTDLPPGDGGPARVAAEVALAPLAAGEYVIEVTATRGASSETRTYALRLVP